MVLEVLLGCIAGLVITVAALVYRVKTHTYRYFSERGIPGPQPTFLFGNTLEFKDKFPLDVFDAWYKQYGKVYGYYEGLTPSLCVTDPEIMKQILGKKFHKFNERPTCVPFIYWPDNKNLINSSGSTWKRAHDVIASVFNSFKIKELIEPMVNIADDWIRILHGMSDNNKGTLDIDFADWADRYAVDSFAASGFGFHLNTLKDPDVLTLRYMRGFFQQGDIENPITGLARLFPRLKPLLSIFNGKFKALHNDHVTFIQRLIAAAKVKRQMYDSDKPRNVLESLLNASITYTDHNNTDHTRGLTEDEVLSQVHGLLGAGFGQANNLLAFTAYLLATHPQVQEKVLQEIDTICNNETWLDLNTLSSLSYLDMVLHETLRMFPVAPGTTRVCTESCEVGGVHVEQGTVVRLMFTPMYKDEQIYPDPHLFKPERFLPEERSKRHAQSWLGFSYGPRMCFGSKFGMLQCKAAIVRLLQNFSLKPGSSLQIPLQTTLRPMLSPKHGVQLTLTSRRRPIVMEE